MASDNSGGTGRVRHLQKDSGLLRIEVPHITEPYSIRYENGIDQVPRFDAQLIVYGETKSVSIQYDKPFDKGLPIVVEVDQLNEKGERNHMTAQTRFEDAYTAKLRELYECLVHSKPIKTSVADAMEDLTLFDMVHKQYTDQLANVRS